MLRNANDSSESAIGSVYYESHDMNIINNKNLIKYLPHNYTNDLLSKLTITLRYEYRT